MARKHHPRKKPGEVTRRGPSPTGGGGIRPSDVEVELRTDKVAAALLRHNSRGEIAAALGLPLGTVDDYIGRARDRWLKNPLPDVDEDRKETIARLNSYLALLSGSKNVSAMMMVEKMRADILGTRAPSVVHLAAPGGGPIEVKAVSEVEEKLRKLMRDATAKSVD